MTLRQGIRFKGNINDVEFEIKSIENSIVELIECKTGKRFAYGLEALKHCQITILE